MFKVDGYRDFQFVLVGHTVRDPVLDRPLP